MVLDSWISAPTDTLSITKVNVCQFLSSIVLWTLRKTGEEKKDAEKRSRYAPVLEFFSSLQERKGWSMIQFNFTVGVEEKSKSNSIGFVLMEQQQQATVSFFF